MMLNLLPVVIATLAVAAGAQPTLTVEPASLPALAVTAVSQPTFAVEGQTQSTLAVAPTTMATLTIGEVCSVSSDEIYVLASTEGPLRTCDGGFFLLDPDGEQA